MSATPPPPLPQRAALSLGEHVRELAWAPDSRQLVAALASGELVLLDPMSGTVARRWAAHSFGVQRVSWSSAGPLILSSGEDGLARIWTLEAGAPVTELKFKGWVEHAAWSPDGRLALLAAGRVLRIIDTAGATVFETSDHASTIASALWRPDGKGFLTACFGRVQIFRLGETAPYQDLRWKTAHLAVAWSPNGRHVAAGSQESTVTYWKLPFEEKEPLHMSGYPHKVRALSFDRENRWLATGGGELITVWSLTGKGPAGSTPLQLKGHAERVSTLAFQCRGDLLASGGLAGDVWLWRIGRGDGGIRVAQFGSEITALAWAPDEKALAVGTAAGEFVSLPIA